MNRLAPLAPLLAVLVSCGGMPKFPPPSGDRAQLVVHLTAKPRKGVKGPRTVSGGGEYTARPFSLEEGKAYERVDYRRLEGIVVLLEGVPGGPGPAPKEWALAAHEDRLEPSWGLLAPGGQGMVRIANRRAKEANFLVLGPRAVEVRVPPGGSADIVLREPGEYEISIEEADVPPARVLVAPTEQAAAGRAGDWILFDGLAGGEVTLRAKSERLPEWRGTARLVPGKRTVVEVTLGVNVLESVRP